MEHHAAGLPVASQGVVPLGFFLMSKRAGFYFDGFNVYHAVSALRAPHLKWMSYVRLAGMLARRDETVEFVKVFTALPHHVPHSIQRFRGFRAATEAEGAQCVMGDFKKKWTKCKKCKQDFMGFEEKQTDVSIAIHLLADCVDAKMDVAYVVSTDSDFIPAIEMIVNRGCPIEIVTVATPGRVHCKEMLALSQRKALVTRRMVESCLLPERVVRRDGTLAATRPAEYDPPV